MGYSIALRCRSAKLRKKMADFLDKNLRDYTKVVKGGNGSVAVQLLDDLSYDHGNPKTSLGFDYSSWMCEQERYYIYAVLRWAAIQIGRKRHWKALGSQYYYVYDGCEATPIILKPLKKYKGYEWAYVDELGWRYPWSTSRDKYNKILKQCLGGDAYANAVKAELKRLDDLWQAQH